MGAKDAVARAAPSVDWPTQKEWNDWSSETVRQVVANEFPCATCEFKPPSEGGRILVARRPILRGEEVARVKPLMIVPPPKSKAEQAFHHRMNKILADRPEAQGLEEEESCLDQFKKFRLEGKLPEQKQEEISDEDAWGVLTCLTQADVPKNFPLPVISDELQKTIFCLTCPEDLQPSATALALHAKLKLRCTPLKLERMMRVWECNSFEHTNREGVSIVTLSVALMNHSCLPTVNWNFEGDDMVVRANCDLAVGEELTVSYIEDDFLYMPSRRRQHWILATGKGFSCGCKRCTDPAERCRSAACPATACAGLVPLGMDEQPEPCQACGRQLTSEEHKGLLEQEQQLELVLDVHERTRTAYERDKEKKTKKEKKHNKEATEKTVDNAEDEDDEDEDDEEEEDDGDDDESSDSSSVMTKTRNYVDKISPADLKLMREIACSGRFLAPEGHWLAHRVHMILADLAEVRENIPELVRCLDRKAAFVRKAYGASLPTPPPSQDLAWDLEKAGSLLLAEKGWEQQEKEGGGLDAAAREAAAELRLKESIMVLEAMAGSQDEEVVKAKQQLEAIGRKRSGADAALSPQPSDAKRAKGSDSPSPTTSNFIKGPASANLGC